MGHLDPIDYHQFIRKIFPAICIVPLVNNAFNQAKSNIAWIEATSAGAVTLAPDMPEWRRPGVVLYNDADTFRDRLLKLIAVGNEGRAKVWNASRRWIEKNLTLATVNELRRDVIEDLELLGKNEKWRAHAISRRGLAIETEGAGPIASKDALGGGKEATQAAAAGDTRAPEMVAGRDPGNG